MLSRAGSGFAALLALAVAGVMFVVTAPASAEVSCPAGQQSVTIGGTPTCVLISNSANTTVNGPALQVSFGGGSGAYQRWCENRAGVAPHGLGGAPEGMVPCFLRGLGWWDGYDCYYLYRPDWIPEEEMAGYEEHGDDGLVYQIRCYLEHAYADGMWFDFDVRVLPEPPEFEGGEPPLVLIAWEEAINQLAMAGPEIGIIPLSGVGLVRLPVWMWDDGPSGHEADAQAEGGPLVAATATVRGIVWDPGDGSAPRGCDQGIPYESGMDIFATDCRHQYGRPSRNEPGGTFQIVATTTWHVQWWIDGVWDGELTLEAASAVDIQINELQVLTSR